MGIPPAPTPKGCKGIDVSKALLDYRKGSQAYFPDKIDGWCLAEAQSDSVLVDGNLKIKFRIGSKDEELNYSVAVASLASNADLPPLKNPDFMDEVEDLSLLSYLHEPAVFWGIKNRFASGNIYTYSGMVLIAMNPFQNVDLYSPETMREYIGSKRHEPSPLPPHIYGIAEECYRAMLEGKNQSVIVSGESGAGKTQSTKYIMEYLAQVDALSKIDSLEALMRPETMISQHKSETEDAVLASNPILESFGNAKTTRNDNSSRFGKFVELFFSDPSSGSVRITGAQIRTYLLERSRLIFQPDTERNYHIFYQLCAAAPAAEKEQLGLDKWETFHYLNQGRAGVVKNMNDVEEFKATQEALSTLGMSVSTQWNIFRLCAALLHIGNIKIIDSEARVEASEISATDPALAKGCELLGIDAKEFVKWVTKKQTVIGRDKYEKDIKKDAAIVARDSVTKVIYTKLFDWLVKSINKNLKRDSNSEQHFIGVLDIYGFEHFKKNSFEQFCINYANEKLQQEFNAHVFRIEQEGYIQEEIEWTFIEFADNQPCIDLIESKNGVLVLLDDESHIATGTDAAFVSNLNDIFKDHKHYMKGRFGNTDFTVKHYAVDVTYTSTGFVDKNKDNMSEELQGVLAASSNAFLREVFGLSEGNTSEVRQDEEYVAPNVKSDRRKSTMKVPTLGSMFKNSLQGLMATIRETEGHYIRCIKPNMAKAAFEFDGAMVLSQLKACGVLETIKISNAGYPNKLEYSEFASRYFILVPSAFWNLPKKDLCIKIVTTILNDTTKFQFGKTKVFLKSGQIAFFEDRRNDRTKYLALLLAKNARRFVQRQKYLRLKEATLVVQNAMRGYLARKKLENLKEEATRLKLQRETEARQRFAAIKIQSVWRGYRARKSYKQCWGYVLCLQNAVRSNASRKLLKTLRAEAKNVEAVKEKAFSLEAKVVSLSQTLRDKTVEAKALQDKCSSYESQLGSLREKLDASEAKNKVSQAEITILTKKLSDLKAEFERLRDEKTKLDTIVAQQAQNGLLPEPSTRSSNTSPTRAERTMSPSRGITRGKTLDSRGRNTVSTPQLSFSMRTALSPPAMVRGSTVKSPPSMSRISTKRPDLPVAESNAGPVKLKRVPTLRQKSIFEQDIVDDAERARKKDVSRQNSGVEEHGNMNMSPQIPVAKPTTLAAALSRHVQNPSTTPAAIAPRTTSMLQNPKLMAFRAEYLSREEFNDILCDNFIINVKAPQATVSPLSKKDVLYPAFVLNSVMTMFLDGGLLLGLNNFSMDICYDISKTVTESSDTALIIFWISNTHHLLNLVTATHLRETKKQNNLSNLNVIKSIQSQLFTMIEQEMVPSLIKRLRDYTASLTIPAILENQELPGMKIDTSSSGIWGVFGSTPKPVENGLLKLKTFLTSVDMTLRDYFAPEALHNRVMIELIRTVGVVSFNGMLVKKNFLNFKRGMQIQYNLTQLEEWCARLGLGATLKHLDKVGQAAKIMTINKTEAVDVQAVFEIAYLLNPSQIDKLYANYSTKDLDSPMTNEFYEAIRFNVDPAIKDTIPLSLDPEPEYPTLPLVPILDLEAYLPLPNTVSVPSEFMQLFG
ncbi:hypothetical protein BCR33DRAFT_683196 [Rhizoclosmatium globosum]|uniref:Myosin-2 n=1 Tax=Rhizoclosmatium globosum TaxID=329046 RepID=A0A1Y2BRM7_9FUNG|nr:hypothetical protein BCR33DRAFT_683196 [Rhizoclosmatium globosum]|eukprot:ORY37287.1 hypothetical protein BCR33DRAFT_683196 [Rhizoclosmatium globosum]